MSQRPRRSSGGGGAGQRGEAGRGRRLPALLLAALLLSQCAPPPPPPSPSPSPSPSPTPPAAAAAGGPALCRIGADDGPPEAAARLADRGIGGTGISGEEGGDRGIGGTGINSTGISTTGIIGVVTGFASICVGGLEVGYDSGQAPEMDGFLPAPLPLRAGQVVVIEAGGPEEALRARSVALRFELVGPVERAADGQGLRVAGQEVAFEPGLRGRRDWRLGEWVAVFGLRRPDGTVGATRLDAAEPGRLLVRGIARRHADGSLRIAGLRVRSTLAMDVQPGIPLVIAGRLAGDVLQPERVETDALQANPAEYFGPRVQRVVVESYVSISAGQVLFGGTRALLPPGAALQGGAPHGGRGGEGARRAVMDMRRPSPGREGTPPMDLRLPGQSQGQGMRLSPAMPRGSHGGGAGGAVGPGGWTAPATPGMPSLPSMGLPGGAGGGSAAPPAAAGSAGSGA
ncbi:hypothetical protein NON00_12005, partial [Roseomonas sp. GC11]|uniref:hypothetical protein n=1 Tax=Roseomonas sp. GC11 TaxID=2950546 RepID=UPI00210D05E3